MAQSRILDDVSRETLNTLKLFEALVLKWTSAINLIAPSTRSDVWTRHIMDSAQLVEFIPPHAQLLCDLGSGGGFPAAVIAIMSNERVPNLSVTCLESDKRKCAFLRTAARECQIALTVIDQRIENVPSINADVVTARAVAPVSALLDHSKRHRHPNGTCLFLKGASAKKEVSEAQKLWHFEPRFHASRTDPTASILEIGEFSRV
jgi:16S rRNA (guanine527-N7)-methyltransferase